MLLSDPHVYIYMFSIWLLSEWQGFSGVTFSTITIQHGWNPPVLTSPTNWLIPFQPVQSPVSTWSDQSDHRSRPVPTRPIICPLPVRSSVLSPSDHLSLTRPRPPYLLIGQTPAPNPSGHLFQPVRPGYLSPKTDLGHSDCPILSDHLIKPVRSPLSKLRSVRPPVRDPALCPKTVQNWPAILT